MNSYSYLPPPTFVDQPSPTASDAPTAATTPLDPPVEGALVPHQPAKGRHERKCSICRHPDRDAIEEAFLHWQSPNEMAADYDLPDLRSLYRHAHATGLYARRKRNLRFALDNLIERVCEIEAITPSSIVRAVRAYTRITDMGEWVEPPRELKVTHAKMSEAPLVSHVPAELAEHARTEDLPVPLALRPRAERRPRAEPKTRAGRMRSGGDRSRAGERPSRGRQKRRRKAPLSRSPQRRAEGHGPRGRRRRTRATKPNPNRQYVKLEHVASH